jgi:hypothetical protein
MWRPGVMLNDLNNKMSFIEKIYKYINLDLTNYIVGLLQNAHVAPRGWHDKTIASSPVSLSSVLPAIARGSWPIKPARQISVVGSYPLLLWVPPPSAGKVWQIVKSPTSALAQHVTLYNLALRRGKKPVRWSTWYFLMLIFYPLSKN